MNSYGKPILTLVAESENITHTEQFRDSRRGNKELIKRMKWLKLLNDYNNDKRQINSFTNVILNHNLLKVTISKNGNRSKKIKSSIKNDSSCYQTEPNYSRV